MALVLENKYSHSSIQNGSTGTLTGIRIGSQNRKFLVVTIATDNTAFNSVSSIYLSSPEIPQAFALTRKTQSTGTEIWFKDETLAYTPGLSTSTLTFNLSGTYNFAAAAYVFYNANQSGGSAFETFWLDAAVTGEPDSPSALSVTQGSYMMDALRISQNTVAADGSQIEEFNLTTGSGATLVSYGSSYEQIPTTTASYTPGWTRQGTPTNATWAYCGAVLKAATATDAKVIAS